MATTKKPQEVNVETQEPVLEKNIPQEFEPGEITIMPAATPETKAITPTDMISFAMKQGASLEEIRGYYDLQKEWLADEAKRAYVRAMTEFKRNVPELPKKTKVRYENKDGSITEYYHTSLSDMTEILGEALSNVGISFTWQSKQMEGGVIHVTCILTHVDGHEETTTLFGSPDSSGGKNNIQAVGSTTSYLKRYTLSTITGTAESTQDDDGKGGAGGTDSEIVHITDDQVAELEKMVKEGDLDEEATLAYIESKTGSPMYSSIKANDFAPIKVILAKKIAAHKKVTEEKK